MTQTDRHSEIMKSRWPRTADVQVRQAGAALAGDVVQRRVADVRHQQLTGQHPSVLAAAGDLHGQKHAKLSETCTQGAAGITLGSNNTGQQ